MTTTLRSVYSLSTTAPSPEMSDEALIITLATKRISYLLPCKGLIREIFYRYWVRPWSAGISRTGRTSRTT